MDIREYTEKDKERVVEIFTRNLETYKNYISHGELQMGLTYDGLNLVTDFKEKWTKYLERHHNNPKSFVYVCEDDATIVGFTILGIENDHDKDYGVVYDMLIVPEYRGKGAGGKILDFALELFKSKDITQCYLESGVDNHSAHAFFEKKGFEHVSNIYRLINL